VLEIEHLVDVGAHVFHDLGNDGRGLRLHATDQGITDSVGKA
jgi:hypothetical protein